MGESKSPKVPIFERFRKYWEKIDQSRYEPGIDDTTVATLVAKTKNETISFLRHQISKPVFRDNYREFLELALLFMGEDLGKKEHQVTFHTPCPTHHARWMAKALYNLRIFLFRNQIQLSAEELQALAQINVFLIKYYIRLFISSNNDKKHSRRRTIV